MKISNFKLKIFHSYWPILFIAGLWFLFASPYFIQDLVPFPSDYLVNNFAPWSAYPGFASPVTNGAMPDVITQIYPWKNLVIEMWKSGQVPLWNSYSFAGTPLLANYQSAALSPFNLLYFLPAGRQGILPFIDAWSIQVLLQPLLAGIFMYLYIRTLKLGKEASLISALAFMFCGFITGWMAYGTLSYAILFLPLALFAIESFYTTKKWYLLTLLSLSIPLSFFSGHFQTSLYFLVLVISYATFKFITVKSLRSYILSLTSIFSGLLLCAPQLLPSIEFYGEAVRSSTFIKTEIIPWSYLPTILAPDFYGNSVTRNDWFGHYAEWSSYIGLVPLMLAFYSLRKRSPYVLFFIITGIISILFAYQTPIQDLLLLFEIPVLSTSAASRIIVLFSFSFAVLAGFGFKNLLEDINNKKVKPIYIWLGIFSLIFVFLWATTFTQFFQEGKELIARSNLKLPTVILAASLFAVFISIFKDGLPLKFNKQILLVLPLVLILITAFDVVRFAMKWQPFELRTLVYPEVPIAQFLKTNATSDRAFGNFGGEATMMLRSSSLEGYDPLYSQRYGEFIEAGKDGLYHQAQRSVVSLSKNGQYTNKVLNFMGVKYVIHKFADGHAIWAFPFWDYPVDQFRTVYKDDSYQIFGNDKALPRVFFVETWEKITNNKNILKTIFREETDLRKKAVLEDEVNLNNQNLTTGAAEIKKYEPNSIQIETKTSGRGLLVLTEPFYPGWEAKVDGLPTKIYRADYAFRAIVVPPGQHNVTFTYMPNSFKMGILLSVFGIVGTAGTAFYLRKQ